MAELGNATDIQEENRKALDRVATMLQKVVDDIRSGDIQEIQIDHHVGSALRDAGGQVEIVATGEYTLFARWRSTAATKTAMGRLARPAASSLVRAAPQDLPHR
jgi:hypothetical protein